MNRIWKSLRSRHILSMMFCVTTLFACNQATSTISVNTDLELTANVSAPTAQIGQNFTYTSTVKNIGAHEATDVKVIDPIPQNAQYISVSTTQGTCSLSNGTITCLLGKVAVNASVKVDLVLTSNTVGSIQNSPYVTASEVDVNTSNNTASSSITMQAPVPQANLQLDGSAAPNPVQVGQNLTYTFNITNAGPDTATNIKFTDVLSANIAYVSSSSAQGTCSYTTTNTTLTCNLNSLALNAKTQVTMVVTPQKVGTLTDTPTLRSAEADPNTANNTTTITADVQPPAVPTSDLALSISAAPNPVLTAQNWTYTINLSNAGPSAASNVKIISPLPQNTNYVSSNASQGTCTVATGTLTCNLGSLNASASASVGLVLNSSVAGTITSSASATGTESDPNTTNNSSNLSVTVKDPPVTGTINLPPTGKVSWDWQIGASGDSNVTVPAGVTLLDLDGFNISASKITSLKSQGIYTVCYIDAGSYEDGRPDSSLYPAYLKIYKDVQWNEWFLDVQDVFRPVQPAGTQLVNNTWVDASGKPLASPPTAGALALLLKARLKMCADKGFDSLEPDNLQNDENAGGKVSLQQQLDFNGWIADAAHEVGLAAFQKNGPDKILLKDSTGKMMVEKFDAILNEECQQYTECAPLAEYVKRGKLALNTEYSQALNCTTSNTYVINSIKKDLGLTGGNMSGYARQSCP
jgi:uncharacterized repeat protein (TIGR01451 family)